MEDKQYRVTGNRFGISFCEIWELSGVSSNQQGSPKDITENVADDLKGEDIQNGNK